MRKWHWVINLVSESAYLYTVESDYLILKSGMYLNWTRSFSKTLYTQIKRSNGITDEAQVKMPVLIASHYSSKMLKDIFEHVRDKQHPLQNNKIHL